METMRKKKGYSDDMDNVDDIYFQAQSIGLEKALIELSKELKISIEELKDKLAPLHPSEDLKKYSMELARSFTPNGINRTKASALLKDKNFQYNKK